MARSLKSGVCVFGAGSCVSSQPQSACPSPSSWCLLAALCIPWLVAASLQSDTFVTRPSFLRVSVSPLLKGASHWIWGPC